MRCPTHVIILLLVAMGLAGCVDDETTSEVKEPNPRFVASLVDPPRTTYDSIETAIVTHITNVQEIKPGQEVGEGGAHQVCARIDGKILTDSEGKPVCELVGLANQETDRVVFGLPPTAAGTYNISILNASFHLEVRETPRVGERIEGTLADIAILNLSETDSGWEFDINIVWTDSEARRLMEEFHENDREKNSVYWPVHFLLVPGVQGRSHYVMFNESITDIPFNLPYESLGRDNSGPLRLTTVVGNELMDSHQLESAGIDKNHFVWCCL